MPSRRPPSRLLLPLVAVALGALGLLATLYGPAGSAYSSEHAEGLDDAYISYRYALNLVHGEGLVFNPGERIEGYSNLLWVLAAALLLQVCPPSLLHFAICVLTAGLAVAGLLVFAGEMRRRHGEARALAAAALWALYPFLWQWIGSGLEAVAVVLLQLLIWRTLSRAEEKLPWRPLLLYFSLLVLLRADGFVFVALAAGHWLIRGRPAWALRTALLGLPATVALFAFRLLYFRDVWPATYYVKVAQPLWLRFAGGLERLAELLTVYLLAPFLLALLWLAWRTWRAWREAGGRPVCPPELSLGFGLLAYWLYIGGDNFKIRFLLVLFPFALAAIFGPLAEGLSRDRKALLALLLLALYGGTLWERKDFRWRTDRYDGWIELGVFLGERHPGAVLAAEAVGKTPYFSGLYTIDMLGLTDAHISKLPPVRNASPGHEKSDGAYVLARKPDLIAGHLRADMSVAPDLSAEAWRAAGYRLAYLVNVANESQPEGNIVPAPASKEAVWIRIFRGYSYAVLVREQAAGG